MFKEIAKYEVFTDRVPGYVSLYNPWVGNHSQSTREQMIADIASISYGNEAAKSPATLYNRLLDLEHLSCFEFLHTGMNSEYNITDSFRHVKFKTYDELGLPDDVIDICDSSVKSNVALFKFKVPIYIARQFMRHRAFSYLEMSRRYVKDSKVPFEFITDNDPVKRTFNGICLAQYAYRLKQGEKPETARGCIPTDAFTEFYALSDWNGLKQFFKLRTDDHAQADIREVANTMLDLLEKEQPKLFTMVK